MISGRSYFFAELSTRTNVFVDNSVDNCAKTRFFAKKRRFATSFAGRKFRMIFIGKKSVLCLVAALAVLALTGAGIFAVCATVEALVVPVGAVVAIDAGHGGYDGGVVGVSGTKESELNLELALILGEALEARGVQVVYTRTEDKALGDTKREEQLSRQEQTWSAGFLRRYGQRKQFCVVYAGETQCGDKLQIQQALRPCSSGRRLLYHQVRARAVDNNRMRLYFQRRGRKPSQEQGFQKGVVYGNRRGDALRRLVKQKTAVKKAASQVEQGAARITAFFVILICGRRIE